MANDSRSWVVEGGSRTATCAGSTWRGIAHRSDAMCRLMLAAESVFLPDDEMCKKLRSLLYLENSSTLAGLADRDENGTE